MEKEQEEMQFLGIFGMLREAYDIILSQGFVFAVIVGSLIQPRSFVILTHLEISELFFSGSISGETSSHALSYDKKWIAFLLFKSIYLVLLLLSITAVVYAVACVYTGRDLTFPNVRRAVPCVWRRLMLTFLCVSAVAIVYNFLAAAIFATLVITVWDSAFGLFAMFLFGVTCVSGSVYMAVVWKMASVVAVLEEDYGFRAMAKSRVLLRGKTCAAVAIFVIFNAALYGVQVLFEKVVVRGEWIWENMSINFVASATSLLLMELVVQTVIYFVCKSYHLENIDKSTLLDHLEVYQGRASPRI